MEQLPEQSEIVEQAIAQRFWSSASLRAEFELPPPALVGADITALDPVTAYYLGFETASVFAEYLRRLVDGAELEMTTQVSGTLGDIIARQYRAKGCRVETRRVNIDTMELTIRRSNSPESP